LKELLFLGKNREWGAGGRYDGRHDGTMIASE
jgi:hypothetical protein